MLSVPLRRPLRGGFRHSWRGPGCPVALEVVIDVLASKPEAIPDSNWVEFPAPDDPVDARPRDPEIPGEFVDGEHPGWPLYFVLSMERHGSIVTAPSPRKSVHNGRSKKERLSNFDDYEASFLPRELADDPTFLRKAATVANAASEYERRVAADAEASDYAPYRSPARALIANYLLIAAEAPWREFLHGEYGEETEATARRDWFTNLPRRAVWVEAPLEETDPRRIRRRGAMLEEGAKRVARRAPGQCVFARRPFRSSTSESEPLGDGRDENAALDAKESPTSFLQPCVM